MLLVIALESTAAALPAQEGDGVVPPATAAAPPRSDRLTPRTARASTVTPPHASRAPPGDPAAAAHHSQGTLALSSDLGTMLGARVRKRSLGCHGRFADARRHLYSVNPDLLLSPASNMKLFTAALALEQFGPDTSSAPTFFGTGW